MGFPAWMDKAREEMSQSRKIFTPPADEYISDVKFTGLIDSSYYCRICGVCVGSDPVRLTLSKRDENGWHDVYVHISCWNWQLAEQEVKDRPDKIAYTNCPHCMLTVQGTRAEYEKHRDNCKKKRNQLVEPEPMPTVNENPFVWELVMADMRSRDDFGKEKYGTRLQGFNGRDALKDAYQEILDAAVYLRQMLYERDGK